MDTLGPLGWLALALGTYLPPLLALMAARGLSHCLSDKPGAAGASLRARAAFLAALLVPLCAGLTVLDLGGTSTGGGGAWAGLLAVPALLALVGVAEVILSASERAGGWLHRVAAWPFWSVAVCLSGLVTVGGQSLHGFVFLLAPAVLLGVAVVDAARGLFRKPVRSNAEVLRFLAPAEGGTTCAVCQETVRNRRVTCTECHAIQHRECWEFIGHCGATGCLCQRVR